MLSLGIRIRIAGEASRDQLAIACDRVEKVRVHDVEPAAAEDAVSPSVVLRDDAVVPGPAVDRVTSCPAREEVGPREAHDPVVPPTAEDRVGARRADEAVVSVRAFDRPCDRAPSEDEAGERERGEWDAHGVKVDVAAERVLAQ